MGFLTTVGKGLAKAGTVAKEGAKMGAKEAFRASLYADLMDDGNKTVSQRIGGAIGDSFREATFGQMGTLGKAISGGKRKGDKSKEGKAPTSGGGVGGSTIGYKQVKTDNVITAINQSAQQVVGALNTLNATQRMGFNAQTNQIQAQAQALENLSGYGEDISITLNEIYDLLDRQSYGVGKSSGSSSSTQAANDNSRGVGQPANDNGGGGGGLIGNAIMGAALGGATGLAGAGVKKLFGKGAEKAETKAAEKVLAKGAEKTLLKSVLKKIPGLGLIAGIGFAADRLMDGDILGAGGELLSGALSTIPGLGTAASVAVDAGLAARDFGAFGDATPASAETVTNDQGGELTPQEINQLFNAVGMVDDATLLSTAQRMFPGRKYNTLKARIKQLHDMQGASSATGNVQLASNEILPGMLGSGEYLSQRQQLMDTSRQGSDIPTLSGTFGTSEGSLRQEEAYLEKAAKETPNKIEITARELVYKADTLTFDVNTIKFVQGSTGSSGAPANDTFNNQTSGPNQGLGNGGNSSAATPAAPPSPSTSRMGASMGAFSASSTGLSELAGAGAGGLGGQSTTVEQNKQLFLDAMNKGGINDPEMRAAMAAVTEGESHFKPKSESDYSKTSNKRIRQVFGKRLGNISDAELTQLKSNPEAFFNKVYGGRLGNDQNEGYKYRGRGYFQLTGKANYKKYGDMIGVDLVKNPDLANDPQIAAQIAVAYMKDRYKGAKGNSTKEKVFRAVGNPVAGTEEVKNAAFNSNMQSGAFAPGKQADLSGINTSGGAAASPVTQASQNAPTDMGPVSPVSPQQQQSGSQEESSGPLTTVRTASGKSAQVGSRFAKNFQGFINDLEATGYKIRSLGGYANRANANNPSKKSYHAAGAAIDINPEQNPNKSTKTDLPPQTAALAAKWGLGWGMNWRSVKDPMHFSAAKGEQGSFDVARANILAGEAQGGAAPSGGSSDASMSSGGGGGGGGASPASMSGSGGLGSVLGGGNPLSSMIGSGGSPFSGISNMLGGIVGSLSNSTSLFSAAGSGGGSQTNFNVASAGPTPTRTRHDHPSSRDPSPGMDDTLAGLIKHAFG